MFYKAADLFEDAQDIIKKFEKKHMAYEFRNRSKSSGKSPISSNGRSKSAVRNYQPSN
jgi:hypothetical protein